MSKLVEMAILNKNMKCQVEPYSQAMLESINRLRQENRLKDCSPQLLKCFKLRQIIQNHQFGYFFKLPVDPYALELSDYWQKIRKPIDLKSIKHKFFLNVYKTVQNFNEDMMLMFGNALYYNQSNQEVFKKIKEISTYYHHEYQQMIKKISTERQHTENVHNQLSEVEKELLQKKSLQNSAYSTLFSRREIKSLGKCLNKLSFQKRRQLLKIFKQKNKDAVVDNQYVELQNLSGKQLFDLLTLAINYKKKDFSKVIVAKAVRHSSEGRQSDNKQSQDQEQSSFEIQDQI